MTAPSRTRCGAMRSPTLAAVAPCEYCGAAPSETVEADAPGEVYGGRQRVIIVPRVDAPRRSGED